MEPDKEPDYLRMSNGELGRELERIIQYHDVDSATKERLMFAALRDVINNVNALSQMVASYRAWQIAYPSVTFYLKNRLFAVICLFLLVSCFCAFTYTLISSFWTISWIRDWWYYWLTGTRFPAPPG